MAKPEKMAPSTKNGAKRVECQPGTSAIAKSNDTTLCTDSTSGRGERGEEPVGPAVVLPLGVGALPAQRHHRVDLLLDAGGPVAESGDVGHEAHDEEHHADGQVGRDREHVPHQRRLEVRPEVALVRVRHEPVGEPHPPGVDQREQARGHDREHRHRLGAPVDRRAPLRPEQVEDGGDQRPRVPDADPEHEGGDVHRPHLRRALARRAHPREDLVRPRDARPRPGSGRPGTSRRSTVLPGMPTVRSTSRLTSAQVTAAAARCARSCLVASRGGLAGARRARPS